MTEREFFEKMPNGQKLLTDDGLAVRTLLPLLFPMSLQYDPLVKRFCVGQNGSGVVADTASAALSAAFYYQTLRTFTFEGYEGTVEYSIEDGCWQGQLLYTHDLITYEGQNLQELERACRAAVGDYKNMLAQRGQR